MSSRGKGDSDSSLPLYSFVIHEPSQFILYPIFYHQHHLSSSARGMVSLQFSYIYALSPVLHLALCLLCLCHLAEAKVLDDCSTQYGSIEHHSERIMAL
jgi:hypothetical protein